MSFAQLKKNRKSSLNKLIQATENLSGNNQKSNEDTRFWKPSVDKSGNGFAVVRFLPGQTDEDVPYVRVFSHGFQGPTSKWLIDDCLTTLGDGTPCPVCEYNSMLWNRGDDESKKQVRNQKRRLSYISNIYVVKDPSAPENEGKVFLFKYGKKIWDKINEKMLPEFDDETPFDPFNYWEGADFKIKIRNVDGYRNYDKSEFDDQTELFDGDDDELEAIHNQLHSLSEFTDPQKFKTYEQLKERLDAVLDLKPQRQTLIERDFDDETPPPMPKEAPVRKQKVVEDDDDDLSFFESLANED